MGLFDWLFDDVLGIIDFPKQQNPYARGQDVTIHSTEAYLPLFKGKLKDVKPKVVAFAGTSGDGTNDDIANDLIHKIFVFGKRVQSIDAVRIDGVDSESSDWRDDKGTPWLVVRKFPNGMDNYTWTYLMQAGFKPEYKFKECCCVYVVAEAGSEVVTSEPNDVRIDLTGLDPVAALDSNGAQYRHENNVEHFYQWLCLDSSGPDWSATQLDIPSWVKAAEDVNIQIETFAGSGEYQSRYSFNHAIDTGLKVHEIIKIFRESIRAHMPFNHSTGKYELILEQDDNYAELEITEADIEGGIRTSESADVGKKVNQVIVKYPDKEQKGKMAEAIYPEPGSAVDLQWLAEDNQQRKSKTITMDACNNHYLAMQQAKIEAEHSREGLQSEFMVKPRVYQLRPGQVVRVTVAERGWNQKPFRILGKTLHKDLFSDLRLREHQPYIYDYHNTGEKPAIPDTTIDPKKLDKPTALSVTDSAYGGKKATWTSTYPKFDWQLELTNGNRVDSGSVTTNSLELSKLVDGTTYVLAVRARNGIGKVSNWTESNPFTYTTPAVDQNTPDNPLSPVIEAPAIENPQTADGFVWKVYYDTTDHGSTPDTQAASYGGLVDYRAGQTFTIPDALPNTVYYVWLGLIKKTQSGELPTQWTKRTVTSGSGIGTDHLSADLKGMVENPFNQLEETYQDAIERAKQGNEIDQLIGLTQIQLGDYATDAINALFSQANTNYITQEYVAEFDGFRAQISEDVGLILNEGGLIKADEFIYYRQKVDLQEGEISTLIQKQTETDNKLTTQSSQIQQNADEINLLTTSLGDTDFNALAIRLNQAENELVFSSVSVASANVGLISEIFNGANTAYELAAQGVNLAVAESKITTLSDENQSQAQSLEVILAIAKGNQASAAQNTQAIADESSARVQQDNVLEASISDETTTRTAAITQINQAIADESSARATQYNQLSTSITYQGEELTALVTRVNDVEVDSAGNASAIADIVAQIEHPDHGLAAAFVELNAQQNDIDGIKATAAIGVTAGGTFTGVYINGTKVSSSITFQSTDANFVDGNGDEWIEFDSVTRKAKFLGTVAADRFVGELIAGKRADLNPVIYDGSGTQVGKHTLLEFTVGAEVVDRVIEVSPIPIEWGDISSVFITGLVNGQSPFVISTPGQVGPGDTQRPLIFRQPKNTTVSVEIYLTANTNTGTATIQGDVLVKVMKESSQIIIN